MGRAVAACLGLLALAACTSEETPPPDSVEALVFRFNLAVTGSDGAGFVDCFEPDSHYTVMGAYGRVTRLWLEAVREGEPTRAPDWVIPRIESLLEDYGFIVRPGKSVESRTLLRPATFLGDLLALYGHTDAIAYLRRESGRIDDLPILPRPLDLESVEIDEAEGRGVVRFKDAPPARIRREDGRWYFHLRPRRLWTR